MRVRYAHWMYPGQTDREKICLCVYFLVISWSNNYILDMFIYIYVYLPYIFT